MTDTELTRLLAEQVMGWVVIGPKLNRRYRPDFSSDAIYVDEDGSLWRGTKNGGNAICPWRPLQSMDDAWMIVERLRGKGYEFYIEGSPNGRYDAQFKRDGDGHFHLDAQHEGRDRVASRAICLAALALRTAGAEVEDA